MMANGIPFATKLQKEGFQRETLSPIRFRIGTDRVARIRHDLHATFVPEFDHVHILGVGNLEVGQAVFPCLLYTSDAADE